MHTTENSETASFEIPVAGEAEARAPQSPDSRASDTPAAHAPEASGAQPGSLQTSIIGYFEKNPLVATAAALALGAAIVMVVRSRSATDNRLDHRAMRVARSMERTFTREMRAVRKSGMAGELTKLGNSVGDAVSHVDLNSLVELGRTYLEAARNRVKL